MIALILSAIILIYFEPQFKVISIQGQFSMVQQITFFIQDDYITNLAKISINAEHLSIITYIILSTCKTVTQQHDITKTKCLQDKIVFKQTIN